jgi:hypothetical protein
MSGQRRLFREGNHNPSLPTSGLNFGLIAMMLLMALAIIAPPMFPDIQLQPAEPLIGP